MDSPIEGQELELEFPCRWTYGVVGREEEVLRAAVAEVVGELEHSVRLSRRSSGGKYLSLEVEIVVPSDEVRLDIFRKLHEHEAVVYVL